MPLNIVLELTDEDLAYFARVVDAVWKKNAKRPEHELIDGARLHLTKARKARAPDYVTKRFEDIALLIDLLEDEEWPIEPEDRRRMIAAVGYFATPKDMISDKIPGIGYLDDALVADLVMRELQHDLQGYRDFCAYRDKQPTLRSKKTSYEDWLAARRQQLVDRIGRRRERWWSRRKEAGDTHPILRYKY